jgi:hypothetical protein
LPDFLGIKGTLGAPKPDIDHVAVAAMGAKTLGRSATGLGGRIGNLIGFGARMTNAVPATPTNATANPLGELLRGLGRPKGN